jgi:type IV pilus assembly protein PilV
MNPSTYLRQRQSGAYLLEALIGILIFSLGILGIVGLQAASLRSTSDAALRAEAVFAANQYIGQMWTADESQLDVYSSGALKGQPYQDFADQLKATQGGAWYADPTVAFDCMQAPSSTSRAVCIVIKWKICADPTNPACDTLTVDVHNFTTSAVIGQNQW